jgi:hypothetical protein
MTLIWFIVWLIANNVGSHEPLLLNPINAWTATLILAIALDLGAAHARGGQRRRRSGLHRVDDRDLTRRLVGYITTTCDSLPTLRYAYRIGVMATSALRRLCRRRGYADLALNRLQG